MSTFAAALLLVAGGLSAQPTAGPVPDWDRYVRIGTYDLDGIPCRQDPRSDAAVRTLLYFKQPLYRLGTEGDWSLVRFADALMTASHDGRLVGPGPVQCYVPSANVATVHSKPFSCPAAPGNDKVRSIASLLPPDANPTVARRTSVGPLFPTYYHVASQDLYPLTDRDRAVTLEDNSGAAIVSASRAFYDAVLVQGTGRLLDGRIINVGSTHGKKRRFIVLPEGSWGLGINGYALVPYRSAAMDFDLLCDRLRTQGCVQGNAVDRARRDKKATRTNRAALVGTLLHLPALAGARMNDGSTHDGFLCAVDVGGGIQADRIDLFVGSAGAGNPYYPDCRSSNPFIQRGVASLIPSDWRHFQKSESGDWARTDPVEYRTVSPDKGLEIHAYPEVKCLKSPRPD